MKTSVSKKGGIPPAMEMRLTLLKTAPAHQFHAHEERARAVQARLDASTKALHMAGKKLVLCFMQTPGADFGRTVAALDALLDARTAHTTSLLAELASAPPADTPMSVDAGATSFSDATR